MTRKVYTPELTAEILAFYAENSAKDTADKFGKSEKAIYVLAYKNKFNKGTRHSVSKYSSSLDMRCANIMSITQA